MKALQTVLSEARPPLGHRVAVDAEPACHLGITSSARTSQHDPATHGKCLGALRTARPSFQRLALVVAQDDLDCHRLSHRYLPIVADKEANAPNPRLIPTADQLLL